MKYREPEKVGWFTTLKEQPKPRLSKKERDKIKRYWLVEISLTSGKSTQFYVQAINKFEAYQKADSYVMWLRDEKLRNELMKFRLRP